MADDFKQATMRPQFAERLGNKNARHLLRQRTTERAKDGLEGEPLTPSSRYDHDVREIFYAVDAGLVGEESPMSRTALGRRLREIRQKIEASGQPLLDWDGIDQEMSQ